MSEKSWEETLQELGYMAKQDGAVVKPGVVSVKYVGSGAYNENGVEVKRKGQVVEVPEVDARILLESRDDSGNALFEAV